MDCSSLTSVVIFFFIEPFQFLLIDCIEFFFNFGRTGFGDFVFEIRFRNKFGEL